MKLDIQMTETDSRKLVERPRRRRAVVVALFWCVAAAFIVRFAVLYLNKRAIAAEFIEAQQLHLELKQLQDQLDKDRRQVDNCRRHVISVLKQCRTPEDIPNFQGDRIVSFQQGAEKILFFVPRGNHNLIISTAGRPMDTPANSQSPAGKSEPAPREFEQQWTLQLSPDAGYVFELTNVLKTKSLHWKLASNASDFEARSEKLAIENFEHGGSSWSSTDVVLFPNQLEQFAPSAIDSLLEDPPGLSLMHASLRGKRAGAQYEVFLEVRVKSDGPPCVSTFEAQRLMILGKRELLKYRGDGKYELQAP